MAGGRAGLRARGRRAPSTPNNCPGSHPPQACPGPALSAARAGPACGPGTRLRPHGWVAAPPAGTGQNTSWDSRLPPAPRAAGHGRGRRRRAGTRTAPASSPRGSRQRARARACAVPTGPHPAQQDGREHALWRCMGAGAGRPPTWGCRNRWQCAGCPSRPARPTACT